MSEQWYYVKAGERCGPVAEDELKAIVDRGEISPGALVWQSGMDDWKPYAEVFPASEEDQSATASAPSIAEGPPAEQRRAGKCANCLKECGPQDLTNRNGRLLCNDCNRAFAVTQPDERNGNAIAGMALSCLSMACCLPNFIFSILGLVFSFIALSNYNKRPEIGGRGLAIAGIAVGAVGIVKDVVITIIALASSLKI